MKRIAVCLLVIMLLTVGCTSQQRPQAAEHSQSPAPTAGGDGSLYGQEPSQQTVPTPTYPVNGYGQTYGSALAASSIGTEPALIRAYGVDGTLGYVLRADLNGPMPKTPEEALAQQRSRGGKARQIPLYAVDGRTVIGVFEVGGGTSMYYTEPTLNSSVYPPDFQENDHAGSQRLDAETSQNAKPSVAGTEASFSFLAPNRKNPAFCFQVVDVPSVVPDDVEPQFRKALEVLAQSPRWEGLHLAADGVQITNGCPQPPYLLQEGVTLPYSGKRDSEHQRSVTVASVETAFVWILSEQSLSKLFGENAIHQAPEEYLCSGHMCAEVTKGLYLSPEDLADSTVLAAKLSGVLIW